MYLKKIHQIKDIHKVLHFTKNKPENIDLQQFSGLKDGLFDGK